MSEFTVGDVVRIDSPGHRRHGQVGHIVYVSRRFMGTAGVEFDGHNYYGFCPSELAAVAE